MSRLPCFVLVVSCLTSCLIVPEGSTPGVNLAAEVASQYNFRGMVNVDRPVMQTEMVASLPTKAETGFIDVRGWANWNLTNDVGSAWFPSGNAGEPSQIDLSASYSETYRGFDFTGGIISYALQNGDDFPFALERGETKEFFFFMARPTVWELVPQLDIHYDFDEVNGWYVNGNVARDFPMADKWLVDTKLSLGYSDENASDWTYGAAIAGWADLRLTGGLNYFLDTNTTLFLTLNVSSIIDSDLQVWLDQIQISSDNFWAAIGVSWGY